MTAISSRPVTGHTRGHAISLPHLPAFKPQHIIRASTSPRTPENWDSDFDFGEQSIEQLLEEDGKQKKSSRPPSRHPSFRRIRGLSVPIDVEKLQGSVLEARGHIQSFASLIEELKDLRETRDVLTHQLRNPSSPAARAFLQSTKDDWEHADVMIDIACDTEATSYFDSVNAFQKLSLDDEPKFNTPPDRQATILRNIFETTQAFALERRDSSSSMCPSLSASSSSSSAASTTEFDDYDDDVFSGTFTPNSDFPSPLPIDQKIKFDAEAMPGLIHYVSELQTRLRTGLIELKSLTV